MPFSPSAPPPTCSTTRTTPSAPPVTSTTGWSVTTERPQGVALDIHDFYSEAPYWWPQDGDPSAPYVRRDGQTNPNRFVANKNALVAMSDAVFTLGTAAYLLDDPHYAQRAARDINTWFINPKSRMNPEMDHSQAIRNFNNGRGAGMVDGRAFIRAIQRSEEHTSELQSLRHL